MEANAFAGGGLDRVSWRRSDGAWLSQRLRDPAAGALVSVRGELAMDAEGAPLLVAPQSVPPLEGTVPVLLGLREDGTPVFAIEAAHPPDGARMGGLRDLVGLLGPSEGATVAFAAAMGNWHRGHRHCANCGGATEVRDAGFRRHCPVCETNHFPRTDPVVIMLIVDPATDRVLLGRQAEWPAGRYSCLAGFVEPGESLEEAVAREVQEESGVAVDEVVYRSSQPWPFPASLMLGFHCRYAGGDAEIRDGELQDLGWFSRADLADGSALLPPAHAIARRLIDEWLQEAR
jgi:NAD+ diphosphatase